MQIASFVCLGSFCSPVEVGHREERDSVQGWVGAPELATAAPHGPFVVNMNALAPGSVP